IERSSEDQWPWHTSDTSGHHRRIDLSGICTPTGALVDRDRKGHGSDHTPARHWGLGPLLAGDDGRVEAQTQAHSGRRDEAQGVYGADQGFYARNRRESEEL